MTLVLLASCQKRVSLFNHVPKDYYTRHHSNEIKSQPREPILCLQKSNKDNSSKTDEIVSRKSKVEIVELQKDLTASKSTHSEYSDYSVKPIYEQSFKSSFMDDGEVQRSRPKVLEGFGVTSMIMSILGIAIPYLILPAVIFGVISLSRHERFPDVFYGRQYAVAGLVISGIVVLLWVLLIALILAVLI